MRGSNQQGPQFRLADGAWRSVARIRRLERGTPNHPCKDLEISLRLRRADLQASTRATVEPVDRAMQLQQDAEALAFVAVKVATDLTAIVRESSPVGHARLAQKHYRRVRDDIIVRADHTGLVRARVQAIEQLPET